MKNKQWYVCMCLNRNDLYVQYFNSEAEANKCRAAINRSKKASYAIVDFVWKSDLHKPFSYLHGSKVNKVKNIMSYVINKAS
jgi:hypothetical protein